MKSFNTHFLALDTIKDIIDIIYDAAINMKTPQPPKKNPVTPKKID